MRMNIDGSGDQFIRIQGTNSYTFCDADSGPRGAESDEEGIGGEERAELNADLVERVWQATADSSDDEAAGGTGGAGVAGNSAGAGASAGEGRARARTMSTREARSTHQMKTTIRWAPWPTPSAGPWRRAAGSCLEECLALSTEQGMQELLGKTILHGWDSKTATGWFLGTVHSRNLSAADLKKTPSANFVVKYSTNLTNKALNGAVACELSARTHGPGEWWVVVEKEGNPGVGAVQEGKGREERRRGSRAWRNAPTHSCTSSCRV